jgi:membrane protein implicated in regulation of membrane protease activity
MTYHPPPPREPNGCLQSLVITKMIFEILAIPIVMIVLGLVAVMIFLYAFSESPLLALVVIAGFGLVLYAIMRWEHRRIERELPPEDQR